MIEPPSNKGGEYVDDEFEEIKEEKSFESENEEIEEEEEEYRTKDPVRRHQFDYDKSTTMVPKYPEAGINQNEAISFAPGEGKIKTNILKEKDWDINSFPHLFPSETSGKTTRADRVLLSFKQVITMSH